MSVSPIVLYPDPRLKTPCQSVVTFDDAVKSVANDLLDTMRAGPPRTVGIAAPQIGAMLKIVVVDSAQNPKYPAGHGLMTLVNPRIVMHEGLHEFREGCLSIPDYTANIRRWIKINVEAQDLDGNECSLESDGFEAVVLQHEIDHVNGILFLDRIANAKTDLFQRKDRPKRG